MLIYVLGSNYYVRILSTIDRELLKPSASVALHKHSNALVDVLPPELIVASQCCRQVILLVDHVQFFIHLSSHSSLARHMH